MTLQDFVEQFKVRYNAVAGDAARALDDYELSVLLTQSQLSLVKRYYRHQRNEPLEGFEETQKRRTDIRNLVRHFKSGTPNVASDRVQTNNSRLFSVPNDMMYIIQERIQIKSDDPCLNGLILDVRPVSHDEINRFRKNPFRRPNDKEAWRMDVEDYNGEKVIEIIPNDKYIPFQYIVRYIRRPSPIIVSNLNLIEPGLTIEGLTGPVNCELDESTHYEILDGAVKLALEAIASPRVQTVNLNPPE